MHVGLGCDPTSAKVAAGRFETAACDRCLRR